jgi:hypothetical protein
MSQHRVVRSVGVRSVARVAFGLSLCVWAIGLIGLVALYILGLVSGGLGGVEGFIASLGFTDFRLSILPFIGVYIVIAGIASAVTAVVMGLLAHLYNALYPLVGGVDVSTEDVPSRSQPQVRPQPPPPRPPTREPDTTEWAPRPGERPEVP